MINVLCFLIALLMTSSAFAHSRWIIPSHTVISGSEAVDVVLDFSISNDIFHPDNPYGGVPLKLLKNGASSELKSAPVHPLQKIAESTKLQVSLPDGAVDSSSLIVNLGRKSSSNYKLDQDGTYLFEVVQAPIYFTSFKTKDSDHNRLFGKLEDVKSKLPKGAKEAKEVHLINRVRTYVSRNKQTKEWVKPSKSGLDIEFKNHPNDLFENEKLELSLLLDGKALSKTSIKITPGYTRYRNQRNVIELKTDNKGGASISWQGAGVYLLEVEVEAPVKGSKNKVNLHALYVTLEVFPE